MKILIELGGGENGNNMKIIHIGTEEECNDLKQKLDLDLLKLKEKYNKAFELKKIITASDDEVEFHRLFSVYNHNTRNYSSNEEFLIDKFKNYPDVQQVIIEKFSYFEKQKTEKLENLSSNEKELLDFLENLNESLSTIVYIITEVGKSTSSNWFDYNEDEG